MYYKIRCTIHVPYPCLFWCQHKGGWMTMLLTFCPTCLIEIQLMIAVILIHQMEYWNGIWQMYRLGAQCVFARNKLHTVVWKINFLVSYQVGIYSHNVKLNKDKYYIPVQSNKHEVNKIPNTEWFFIHPIFLGIVTLLGYKK